MDRLLKPEEVAEMLGVKVSTIYQWTHQRYIPHIKIKNLVRFREKEVEKWLGRLSNKGRQSRKLDIRELLDMSTRTAGIFAEKVP